MHIKKVSWHGIILLGMLMLTAAGCNKTTTQVPAAETPATQTPAQIPTVQTYTYQGVEGKTALELLKTKYQVETKEYSGLGEFVVSINGVKPDEKHFWSFYLNSKPSQLGAGQYKTKNSDQVEWKLETINAGN